MLSVSIRVRPPPVQALILDSEREVEQHRHERHAAVQSRRQDVVVPLPPPLPVPENEEVEHGPHRDPRRIVERRGGWHVGGGAEEHGEVDEGDPVLLWEQFVEEPDQERAKDSTKEEPIEGGIFPVRAEDALRADQPPDHGCVEEDVVARARPGVVPVVAYAFHGGEKPPCNAYVYCPG